MDQAECLGFHMCAHIASQCPVQQGVKGGRLKALPMLPYLGQNSKESENTKFNSGLEGMFAKIEGLNVFRLTV